MMIKKLSVIFIVIFLLVPTTVYADVVWGNEFLDKNRDKTIEIDRQFIVNSTSGFLTTKEAPDSKNGDEFWSRRSCENGEVVYLNRVYKTNGKYWGIDDYQGHGGPSGWFPMDQLLMMYDYQDFDAEHKDEYYNYTGNLNAALKSKKLALWQWPGSDREKRIIEEKILSISAYHAYVDNDGREWVYVNIESEYYLMPIAAMQKYDFSTWICLSDPTNDGNIRAFNPAPVPQEWTPSSITSNVNSTFPPDESTGNPTSFLPIVIFVIVLVIGTTILIWVFWKRNKNRAGEKSNS